MALSKTRVKLSVLDRARKTISSAGPVLLDGPELEAVKKALDEHAAAHRSCRALIEFPNGSAADDAASFYRLVGKLGYTIP